MMDESQLIAACKKHNRKAQKALYERYAQKMMGVCLRYCKNKEIAQDLLHDGFLQVFTQIGTYAGKGSFEGWMRKIFVNIALENYRKLQKDIQFYADYAHDNESYETPEDGDILDIGDIPRNEILHMIQELPDGYRTVFNAVIFEDMNHKEIGKLLGITEGASRSQFFRAKNMLQKKIEPLLKKKYL